MWSRKRTSNGASKACRSLVSFVNPRPSTRATMYTPGRTAGSLSVSKTRIFLSSSSKVIAPLLHDELADGLSQLHVVQRVEPFLARGQLEPAGGAEQAAVRDALAGAAQLVAHQGVADLGLEVVPDHPEPGRPRRGDVAGPLLGRRVGVVHDERLLRVEARGQQDRFAVAALEHVHVDPHVRVEQPLPAERTLAGPLDSAKNDRFHVIPAGARARPRGSERGVGYGRRARG